VKFILGLLIGLGLGVAVGLLLAPQSGEATRAQLTEQGNVLLGPGTLDELHSRANDALSQGRELYTRTKNELADRYSQVKSGSL
jgi:gas vesicle protein